MRKVRTYSLDEVKVIISKCNDKTEFHKKYYRVYLYCKNMGWLDEITELLPRKRKWTFETLKIEAQKYKTRGEFMNSNISAYNVALKSGRYEEIVSHMGEPKKFSPEIKWDYDSVKKLYDECKNLKELRLKYGQKIIIAAKKNEWHKEFSKHFVKDPHPNLFWTFERVKKEAKKYDSKKEFGVKCPSAYQRAITMEWMDKISSHMKNGYTKWTKEKMFEIISDCKNMKDVKKKSSALYVYIKRHKIQDQFFKL